MTKTKGENKTQELLNILNQDPKKYFYLKDLEKELNTNSKKLYQIVRRLNLNNKIIIHGQSYNKYLFSKIFKYEKARIRINEKNNK